MTDLVQNARERIAALRQEIEMLESFVAQSERVAAILGTATPRASADAAPHSPVDESPRPVDRPRTRVTDNPKPATVVAGAIEILRARGKPMTRRELHGALAARGLEVKGADPVKALGTMLWRGRDRIDQIEGRGYWPKGDAVPPLDFDDLLG